MYITLFEHHNYDSIQELLGDLSRSYYSNHIEVKAGNSFTTWFGEDKILSVAFSRLRPAQAYIDIQLDSIYSDTEGLLQLQRADPMRAYHDMEEIESLAALYESDQSSGKGSGLVMYGQCQDLTRI